MILIDESILAEVSEERRRQLEKWGDQKHNLMTWIAILTEELGEAAKAALDGPEDSESLGNELIQVAAVAVAAVRDLRREAKPDDVSMPPELQDAVEVWREYIRRRAEEPLPKGKGEE